MEKTAKSRLNFSFIRNYRYRINSGFMLMALVVLALGIANSPLGDEYASLWNHEVKLQIGDFNLFSHNGHHMTLMSFINDALMTIFFFSVGLEIKRESLVGDLSSFRQALLPVVAACGGMIMPVIIYYLMAKGTPGEPGLAIPMATDIAFSLGVLSLFGKRVPMSLKIFLTAFAVVDDIGGILVIALFYTSEMHLAYLFYSLFVLIILLAGNKMNIYNRWFYLLVGVVLWYLFLQSGIHATIAGVIVALTIPARPDYKIGRYINYIKENADEFPHEEKESIVLNKQQIDALKRIETASDRVISPLQSLEDDLHGLVNYFVIPVFAFANAGVVLTSANGGLEVGLVTYAVMMGLVLGKFTGIYLFTWLLIRSGLVKLGQGMTWKNLTGVCMLGGVGFTVALFIANLSFGNDNVLLSQAKLGVLGGSLISGLLGYFILKFTLDKEEAVA